MDRDRVDSDLDLFGKALLNPVFFWGKNEGASKTQGFVKDKNPGNTVFDPL